MTTEKLSSQRVETIFSDCLFKDGEDTSTHVVAKGITINVGFHPGRLAAYKPDIDEMLNELPNEFQQHDGGGWSFLNACNDKNGNQWTGLHRTMKQLVLLGIASGKVEFQLSRDMWSAFPGGMPYFTVKE